MNTLEEMMEIFLLIGTVLYSYYQEYKVCTTLHPPKVHFFFCQSYELVFWETPENQVVQLSGRRKKQHLVTD